MDKSPSKPPTSGEGSEHPPAGTAPAGGASKPKLFLYDRLEGAIHPDDSEPKLHNYVYISSEKKLPGSTSNLPGLSKIFIKLCDYFVHFRKRKNNDYINYLDLRDVTITVGKIKSKERFDVVQNFPAQLSVLNFRAGDERYEVYFDYEDVFALWVQAIRRFATFKDFDAEYKILDAKQPGYRNRITLYERDTLCVRQGDNLNPPLGVQVFPTSLVSATKRIERYIKTELDALKELALSESATNLMQLQCSFLTEQDVKIVYTDYPGVNLRERLAKAAHHRVDFREALETTLRIARGLFAMHQKKLGHLNLHPEVIRFMDPEEDYSFELAVFNLGFSTRIPAAARSMTGILGFAAPELMFPEKMEFPDATKPISYSADIYSLGMILYVMILGVLPFKTKTSEEIFAELKAGGLNITQPLTEVGCPKQISNLVSNCLAFAHEARIQSVKAFLAHDAFKLLDFPSDLTQASNTPKVEGQLALEDAYTASMALESFAWLRDYSNHLQKHYGISK